MGDDAERQGAPQLGTWVDFAVRLGAIAILGLWCFGIIASFVGPLSWGVVIAVAVASPYERLRRAVGGRTRLASVLFVPIALLLLIVPAVLLSETLVGGAASVGRAVADGELEIPPAAMGDLDPRWMLYPAFAMFLLPVYLMARLVRLRFGAVGRGEMPPEFYRAFQGGEEPYEIRVTTRSFINQFEVPCRCCRWPRWR